VYPVPGKVYSEDRLPFVDDVLEVIAEPVEVALVETLDAEVVVDYWQSSSK
jgi:hypothetical protein